MTSDPKFLLRKWHEFNLEVEDGTVAALLCIALVLDEASLGIQDVRNAIDELVAPDQMVVQP